MKRSSAAFTLIELLVVISIIALLIGILLPALGAARSTARDMACLSNQRQIGIGLYAYAQEHKGTLPISYWHGGTAGVTGRAVRRTAATAGRSTPCLATATRRSTPAATC